MALSLDPEEVAVLLRVPSVREMAGAPRDLLAQAEGRLRAARVARRNFVRTTLAAQEAREVVEARRTRSVAKEAAEMAARAEAVMAQVAEMEAELEAAGMEPELVAQLVGELEAAEMEPEQLAELLEELLAELEAERMGGGFMEVMLAELDGTSPAGPPPMAREHIAAIHTISITAKQMERYGSCVVCKEDFTEGKEVNQLECEHIYHEFCIKPWLELHATCPLCRKEPSQTGGP